MLLLIIHTNAVFALSAVAGGKENNAVVSTSDFAAISGKDKVDENRSCVSNPLYRCCSPDSRVSVALAIWKLWLLQC